MQQFPKHQTIRDSLLKGDVAPLSSGGIYSEGTSVKGIN